MRNIVGKTWRSIAEFSDRKVEEIDCCRIDKSGGNFMLNRIRFGVSLSSMFVSVFALLFIYRLGSARVDKGTEPGLRDLGTYLNAGSAFFAGDNPYSDPYMRAGPSLLPLFGTLDLLVPKNILAVVFQLLSLLGPLYLVYVITKVSVKNHLTIYLAIIWFSTIRENLVNIQITGLLALFFGFGLKLLELAHSRIPRFIGLYLLALVVDTKPHIFGLLVLALLVYRGNYKFLMILFSFVALNHFLLSLFIGEFLTLSWMSTLFGLYDNKAKGNLGESLMLWPILEYFGVNPIITANVSLICFALLFSLIFYRIYNKTIAEVSVITMSLIIPTFGFFYHYYDLAIVVAIWFAQMFLENRNRLVLISLPFLLIPSGIDDNWNLVIVLGIYLLIRSFEVCFAKISLFEITFAIGVYVLYSLLLKFSIPLELKQQVQITALTFSLAVFGYIYNLPKSKIHLRKNEI